MFWLHQAAFEMLVSPPGIEPNPDSENADS